VREDLEPGLPAALRGASFAARAEGRLARSIARGAARLSGPVLVAAAAAAMLAFTWRRWPDLLVDFGRELYLPWRLVEGEILYRDLAHFNGPLSPYFNALAFRVLGVGLETLVLVNLGLAAGLVALLYRLIATVADPRAATVAGLVFCAAFGFGQLDEVGNYNYLTPYSHEITHGLLLGLLATAAAARAAPERRAPAALAGLLLGLVFLTKAEVFLAAAGAVGAGLGLALWSARAPARRAGRELALLGLAALAAPLAALALLATAMPWPVALRGTLGSFAYLFDAELTSLDFYRGGLGTYRLADNLARGARWTLVYGLLFVPLTALALRARSARARRWLGPAALAGLLAAALFVEFGPTQVVRPLPLLLPPLAAPSLLELARARRAGLRRPGAVLRCALLVYAFLLLAKIFFRVVLDHYGFALAMPGTLLLVAALVSWLPAWVEGRGGAGGAVRALALGAAGIAAVGVLGLDQQRLAERTVVVGSGADAFLADARGHAVNQALREIGRRVAPGETLAVLPEGVMINYLARRVNPTGFVNFLPPELLMFGEDAILAAFARRPPDWVLLAHRDTGEYGVRFFGRDYGRALHAFVLARYRAVWQVGAPPLRDDRFGLRLLERRDPGDSGARSSGQPGAQAFAPGPPAASGGAGTAAPASTAASGTTRVALSSPLASSRQGPGATAAPGAPVE
jgi:hypothetical protein